MAEPNSQLTSPVTSPITSQVTSPVTSPITSPITSPVTSPVTSQVSQSSPAMTSSGTSAITPSEMSSSASSANPQQSNPQSDQQANTDENSVPEWLQKVKALKKHEESATIDEKGHVILAKTISKSPEQAEQASNDDLDKLVFESALENTETAQPLTEAPSVLVEPAESAKLSELPKPVESAAPAKQEDPAAPSWIKDLQNPSPIQQKLTQEQKPVSDAEKKILEYITPPVEAQDIPKEQAEKASLNFDKLPETHAEKAVPELMNEISTQDLTSAAMPQAKDNETVKVEQEVKKKQEEKLVQKKNVFADLSKGLLSILDKGKTEIEKGKVAGINEAQKGLDGVVKSDEKFVNSLAVPEKAKTGSDVKSQAKTALEEKQKLLEAEKVFQEGMATVRDLIAPSSMEIKYDLLRIEGMYARSFYVYAYPRYLDTNWLSPVVNFDVTMDIAQFIYPIDSAKIMNILRKKVTQMQSAMAMNAEKGLVRDPALETAYEDAEQLRTEIQRGQEKFFQFAMYFTIYGDDEKKLTKISKQLESILGGKLILTKRADLRMEHGFTSTLPLCLDEIEVYRNMNTSPLSTTFPFSSTDLTSNEGVLYGLNRHNDSLIIFDRFSLENANSVVFAKSGAGKSYSVKLEILRYLMLGTDVIVIDPENEYEALAQTVGGSYLRVSLTSDRRINPFDLPAPLKDEELQPGDLLRSNIINLHGLLKIMLGGVTPVEEGIIDKALNDVYALKGITMDILDPSEMPVPTMEDLYDLFMNMEGGQSLGQRLQKYTQGTYSGIFNKPTNLDLKGGLMVFSIRDLEDGLRPIAMYIILNFIWNRIRSSLKKRIMVVDEAWTMMQYEDSAKFLFGLVKRARKYYLGITTITQDVEDFIKSPYGKPIVTNSSMQLLLKQAPASMDILSKVFNLTEGEKYMLLNSGIGQGLFFAGLKHVAIQCIASYTEDKIVTTNPEEILRGLTTIAEEKFEN